MICTCTFRLHAHQHMKKFSAHINICHVNFESTCIFKLFSLYRQKKILPGFGTLSRVDRQFSEKVLPLSDKVSSD